MPHEKFFRALLFFAILLSGCLYWKGINGGYHYDDSHVLLYNPFLNTDTVSPSNLILASLSFVEEGRELSMLSFALNKYFLGGSIQSYRVVNIVIHCFNGILLFILMSRLVRVSRVSNHSSGNDLTGHIPLAVTALWLVHPINLTSVLYISQRMNQLSAFFILLGLISYLWARCEDLSVLRKRLYPPLVLFVYTLFGYKFKENAALLPIFSFMIELTLLGFQSHGKHDRWIMSIYAIGIISVTVFILGRFWIDPYWLTAGYENRFFSLEERVLTQSRVLISYLINIFLPSNEWLSLWHDDIQISYGFLSPPTTLFSFLALFSMLFTAIIFIRKVPFFSLGILWFFVSHLIESTALPLELVHEHRNYLASFGIILAFIMVLTVFIRNRKKILSSSCLCLFVYFSVVLGQRAYIWGDDIRHAEHNVRHHPQSANASYNLARNYYLKSLSSKNDNYILKALHAAQNASDHEKYSILPEVFLIGLSGDKKIISFNPLWMIRAVEKFDKYPYMVPSQQSLRDFVGCLSEEQCKSPPGGILPLVKIASASDSEHLLTTAARYWMNIENDSEKAEQLYKRAWEKGSSLAWINYIGILIHNDKTLLACDIYREFRNRYENREFRNIILWTRNIASLESRLSPCPQSE